MLCTFKQYVHSPPNGPVSCPFQGSRRELWWVRFQQMSMSSRKSSRGKIWNKEKNKVKIRNKVQDIAVLQLLWGSAICVKGLLQLTVSLLFWHFIIFGAALMVIEFGISANSQYYSLLIFQFVHDYLKSQLPFIYTGKITAFFCPRFPTQNWGCGWSFQVQTATNHQPFHPGLCVPLSRCRLPPVISHSTLAYVYHYPGAYCHQSSAIPPWPICVSLSRCRLPPVISHSTLAYVYHYPGAYCHQSSAIPPWPMCTTIQVQTATSHQPFHPGLCVSLSRCILPPVISHSTLAYVCHYPGAYCHQSSAIPPWPMCTTIQVQTATSHQPFHPGLCVSLSRCILPPVISHSTLAYVYHYPGAYCHQSSAIPPWPMCVTIQVHSATSHQPFHPGLCVPLSRSRLPPVIKHSTLAYVCHYPGTDCHQSSTIPPWPMCVTIQVQTATSHQPFHPGLCVSLSRCRLPPVINHSTLAYVYHYPGAYCHQSSTIPPWPMCVTIQVQTATSHQPFHPGLCVPLSRCRLPPVINHSTLAYVCHYPGAYCHQSSTIPPWPMYTTIQGPFIPAGWLNHWKGWAMRGNYHRHNVYRYVGHIL